MNELSPALAILGISSAVAGIYAAAKPKRPELVDITAQLPRSGWWPEIDLSRKTEITLHHTATALTTTPAQIANINMNRLGTRAISYHVLTYEDGRVFLVNPLGAIAAHNLNRNTPTIGVCMVGNFHTSAPSKRHLEVTVAVIKMLHRSKDLPNLNTLYGHNENRATACPGQFIDMAVMRRRCRMTVPTV